MKPLFGHRTSYHRTMTAHATSPIAQHGLSFGQLRAFGPLAPLLEQPGLRDILVQVRDGRGEVWVDVGQGVQHLDRLAPAPSQIADLARSMVEQGGRSLDELHPYANVRLGSGIRVHAVLAPLVPEGAALSIRVPRPERPDYRQLVRAGLCEPAVALMLYEAVRTKKNLLLTGATGSGKTTLLAALLDEVPSNERIVSLEDVRELKLRHPHHLALEARLANAEGRGAVSVDVLLAETLRMRPDRIVVGECRGPELVTLMAALNTGHDGGAGTLHASTLDDVPARLEALGLLAGLSREALARQAASAFQYVVHLEREGQKHRISAVGALELNDGHTLQVHTIHRGAARGS